MENGGEGGEGEMGEKTGDREVRERFASVVYLSIQVSQILSQDNLHTQREDTATHTSLTPREMACIHA